MARLFIGGLPPGGVEVSVDDLDTLEWSSVVPGGDDRCSFSMTCAKAGVIFGEDGLPLQRTEVRVTGSETMDILWIGWLRKPRLRVERGVFVGIVFEAEGYQYSGLVNPFEEHVKYGPASVGSSSLSKVVTTSVADAMDHARTQKTPAITGARYFLSGPNFDEDSESFYGKTAVDVWNTANNIVGYFANPLYWQVYAIDGRPTLELFPHGGTPDYFSDTGDGIKASDLEFDANDVIWRVVASFGGTQNYEAPAVPVTPAIATSYAQSKVLNLETEAKSLTQVTQVAEAAVVKLNVVRITGGTLTVDRPLRGNYCTEVPAEYLRAGRMIDVLIPASAAPYHTDQPEVGGDISGFMYIMRCSYNAKTCEATLSPSAYTDEAKALRMIPFQNSPTLTWGIAFGSFGGSPKLDKLYPEGSSTIPTRGDPTAIDNPIIGSMIPTSYKTDTNHDYGRGGGVIPEVSLPKNGASANFQIEGLRDASGLLQVIIGEAAMVFQPVPEMVVERIVLLSPLNAGSITLRFHKFNRLSETTTTNFIGPASLTAEQYSETLIASADPDPGDPETRSIFQHGDWIIIDVDGDWNAGTEPVDIKSIGIGVMGRKIVESVMPPRPGPSWVNRPASPTWPHLSQW